MFKKSLYLFAIVAAGISLFLASCGDNVVETKDVVLVKYDTTFSDTVTTVEIDTVFDTSTVNVDSFAIETDDVLYLYGDTTIDLRTKYELDPNGNKIPGAALNVFVKDPLANPAWVIGATVTMLAEQGRSSDSPGRQDTGHVRTTSDIGYATFAQTYVGRNIIKIEKPGYATIMLPVYIRRQQATTQEQFFIVDKTDLDVDLYPLTAKLSGILEYAVTSSLRKPAVGATVRLTFDGMVDDKFATREECLTGSIPQPSASYCLETPPGSGIYSGKITNPLVKRVYDATVDANGHFTFDNLPANGLTNYSLVALQYSRPGATTGEGDDAVTAPDTVFDLYEFEAPYLKALTPGDEAIIEGADGRAGGAHVLRIRQDANRFIYLGAEGTDAIVISFDDRTSPITLTFSDTIDVSAIKVAPLTFSGSQIYNISYNKNTIAIVPTAGEWVEDFDITITGSNLISIAGDQLSRSSITIGVTVMRMDLSNEVVDAQIDFGLKGRATSMSTFGNLSSGKLSSTPQWQSKYIALTWDTIPGATGYRVFRKDNNRNSFKHVKSGIIATVPGTAEMMDDVSTSDYYVKQPEGGESRAVSVWVPVGEVDVDMLENKNISYVVQAFNSRSASKLDEAKVVDVSSKATVVMDYSGSSLNGTSPASTAYFLGNDAYRNLTGSKYHLPRGGSFTTPTTMVRKNDTLGNRYYIAPTVEAKATLYAENYKEGGEGPDSWRAPYVPTTIVSGWTTTSAYNNLHAFWNNSPNLTTKSTLISVSEWLSMFNTLGDVALWDACAQSAISTASASATTTLDDGPGEDGSSTGWFAADVFSDNGVVSPEIQGVVDIGRYTVDLADFSGQYATTSNVAGGCKALAPAAKSAYDTWLAANTDVAINQWNTFIADTKNAIAKPADFATRSDATVYGAVCSEGTWCNASLDDYYSSEGREHVERPFLNSTIENDDLGKIVSVLRTTNASSSAQTLKYYIDFTEDMVAEDKGDETGFYQAQMGANGVITYTTGNTPLVGLGGPDNRVRYDLKWVGPYASELIPQDQRRSRTLEVTIRVIGDLPAVKGAININHVLSIRGLKAFKDQTPFFAEYTYENEFGGVEKVINPNLDLKIYIQEGAI